MQNNNQPQSQQTKREPGYYWVKCQPMKGDIWLIALFRSHGRWVDPAYPQTVDDEHWEEIDERRIKRHSPTEQPGDAKHTPLPQGKYYYGEADENNVKPVFGAHDQLLWFSAPGWTTRFSDEKEARRAARAPALLSEVSTLRSKQAELVAERDELNTAIAHVWKALGITDYTGKHISEHVSELVAENSRLKAECSSHEKERYEIYSFDSSQAMEIKALQKELEQLRSERDKMREGWKE